MESVSDASRVIPTIGASLSRVCERVGERSEMRHKNFPDVAYIAPLESFDAAEAARANGPRRRTTRAVGKTRSRDPSRRETRAGGHGEGSGSRRVDRQGTRACRCRASAEISARRRQTPRPLRASFLLDASRICEDPEEAPRARLPTRVRAVARRRRASAHRHHSRDFSVDARR